MQSAQIPSGALPTIFGSDFDAVQYENAVRTLNVGQQSKQGNCTPLRSVKPSSFTELTTEYDDA